MKQPANWNAKSRPDLVHRMLKEEFDLVIIGGGITGAGVAREAALRGISFCLIDKNDFAFGTSSRSSKLAHGGLRYLSQGDFGLVRLSTTERNWLRHHVPNLVRPAAFVTNSYSKSSYTPGKLRLGMFLYSLLSDSFSRFRNFKKHVFIKPDDIHETEPGLKSDGLRLSALYYDTNVDDARLTLETVREAVGLSGGKSVAVNYIQATDFMLNSRGKIYGAFVKDNLTGQRFSLKGKAFVNASGIWTDEILKLTGSKDAVTRPTKGVHIVVPNSRIGNRNAIGIQSVDDGRNYFILSRDGVSVIGTTDTDYRENLDEPFCTKADCEYLFHTVNLLFPEAKLTTGDIISTYAGIRPLVREKGKAESSVSRKHAVIDSGLGLVTIVGGKLTEFRRMAEDTILALFKKRYLKPVKAVRNFSRKPYRVGMSLEEFNKTVMDEKLAPSASFEQLKHIHAQYGRDGIDILKKMQRDRRLGEALVQGHPFCRAEIEHILEHEMACTLKDVMCRRTEMQMLVWHHRQKDLARQVADIMGNYLGWNQEKKNSEMKSYLIGVEQSVRFFNAGQTAKHDRSAKTRPNPSHHFRSRPSSRHAGPARGSETRPSQARKD